MNIIESLIYKIIKMRKSNNPLQDKIDESIIKHTFKIKKDKENGNTNNKNK